MKKYIDDLNKKISVFRKSLIELSIYSNGSISLETLYSIPISDLNDLDETIIKKLKSDRGIKEQQML
jgi:hypothetical protein